MTVKEGNQENRYAASGLGRRDFRIIFNHIKEKTFHTSVAILLNHTIQCFHPTAQTVMLVPND